MKRWSLLIALLCVTTAIPAQDRAWWDTVAVAQPASGDWTRQSFHMPMRDGVRLAVDLYLPEGAGTGNRMAIELLPTSHTFKAGHRVRLVFRTTDRDHFAAAAAPFTLSVWTNIDDSRLDLPVE